MTTKQIWDAVWQNSKRPKPLQLVEEIDREQWSQRCQRIVQFLELQGLNLTGLSVVEVGCGSAIYSCIMARLGADVTALDQSGEALSKAQERSEAVGVTLNVVQGDALEFARSHRGQYDLAMSFGTVEHFRPPLREQMCKAHWDLVRPGGIVVISAPNLLFLPHEILKRLLIMRKKWFLGYEGSFTLWELKKVGRRLGLTQKDTHGTDLTEDVLEFWKIVTGTRLWARWFPWWRPTPGLRGGSNGPSDPPGRFKALANRYLGHDITLLGVKSG